MVEMGGVEPPSKIHSHMRLRACSGNLDLITPLATEQAFRVTSHLLFVPLAVALIGLIQ